jgi:hypothetical protein
MDFSVYQQFWRLLGVDQFQINGIGAKYWEPDDSFVQSFHDLVQPIFSDKDCPLPVVCSGQWGGQAPPPHTGPWISCISAGAAWSPIRLDQHRAFWLYNKPGRPQLPE